MSDTDKSPLEFKPLGQRGINLTGESRDPIDDPLPDADDLADLLDQDDGRLTADMLSEAANADAITDFADRDNDAEAQPLPSVEVNAGAPVDTNDTENDHAMIASAIASLVGTQPAVAPRQDAADMAPADTTAPVDEPATEEPVAEAPAADSAVMHDIAQDNADYDIDSLGGSLRHAREQRGLGIPEIAEHLRIRKVHLTAIEEENWDELPGAVYIIGYLRSYGSFLGFEPQDLIDRYKNGDSGKLPANDLTFRSPQKESRMPKWSLIAATLVVAAGGYAGWIQYQSSLQPAESTVLQAPQTDALADSETVTAVTETAPATPAPTETDTTITAASVEADITADTNDTAQAETDATVAETAPDSQSAEQETAEPVVIIEEAPAPETVANVAADAATDTVTAAAPAPLPDVTATETIPEITRTDDSVIVNRAVPVNDVTTITETPQPEATVTASRPSLGVSEANAAIPAETGPAGGDSRITLIGRADAYIFIADQDGEELVKRLLRKDEQFHVPNLPGLKLVTGNAGGLEVTVDGRPGKSLGPIGAVLRNLALDPEALQAE